MYKMLRPSGKKYFWMWWNGIRGAFALLRTLNYHHYFRHFPILRSSMRRILWAYIIHRGAFILWGINMHFFPDPKAYDEIRGKSGGRYLENLTDEQATEDAKLVGESLNSLNSHSSDFFEPGAESISPIVCLNTEHGNIPGKYVDMNEAVYAVNGEIKKCEEFTVVPETILLYKHQPMNYTCAPRGYSTDTKEPLWNAVYLGENGNILGSTNLDKSEITYIEGGEVKTSSTSFAVLC
jgi:hypothetical protein